MVRVAVIDLEKRIAVVRADNDGTAGFPHALRGTLAALLSEPTWHVVVALDDATVPSPAVAEVLRQASGWAREQGCRLTVASFSDVGRVAAAAAAGREHDLAALVRDAGPGALETPAGADAAGAVAGGGDPADA